MFSLHALECYQNRKRKSHKSLLIRIFLVLKRSPVELPISSMTFSNSSSPALSSPFEPLQIRGLNHEIQPLIILHIRGAVELGNPRTPEARTPGQWVLVRLCSLSPGLVCVVSVSSSGSSETWAKYL